MCQISVFFLIGLLHLYKTIILCKYYTIFYFYKVHVDSQFKLLRSVPHRPGRLPVSHIPRYPREDPQRLPSALAHLATQILLQTGVGAL